MLINILLSVFREGQSISNLLIALYKYLDKKCKLFKTRQSTHCLRHDLLFLNIMGLNKSIWFSIWVLLLWVSGFVFFGFLVKV